jgi:hypothetical protein
MENCNYPNLFIVGAPKCGTTSLYKYLQQHPDVFFPEIKEPGFFDTDHLRPNRLTTQQYLELYKTTEEYKYKGDASPMYLISKEAAKNIKNISEAKRIIIMIRNPVEMVYSRYLQNLYNGVENINNFEMALVAETERRQRKDKQLKSGQPIQRLYYSECAAYSEQINRYFQIFGKNNVKVVLFEDLISETEKVFFEILQFLNLSQIKLEKFENHNPATGNRNNVLHRILKYPPPIIKKVARTFFSQKMTTKLYQFLRSKNAKKISKTPLSSATKERLFEMYKIDIQKTAKLINKDLIHWR